MSWRRLRKVVHRALFFPSQADRDLDDEIRFHLTEEARLLSERGLCDDEAAAAARRAFGNIALAKEETRAVWVSTRLEQLPAGSPLRLSHPDEVPGVSLTAVILIALVIGGNTTVFSIAHSVLAKPSPGVRAARLATVSWVAENGEIETHAELSGLLALPRAQRRISTDRGLRLRAPDAGARQRQLRRSRGNRLAELFRDARRAPRQGTELLRRRGSAGPRGSSWSSLITSGRTPTVAPTTSSDGRSP